MTQKKLMRTGADWKALLSEDADLMRELVRHVMQEILEAEMTEALGAGPGERTDTRLGHCMQGLLPELMNGINWNVCAATSQDLRYPLNAYR